MDFIHGGTGWQQKTNDGIVVSIQFSSEVVAVLVLLDVDAARICLANVACSLGNHDCRRHSSMQIA